MQFYDQHQLSQYSNLKENFKICLSFSVLRTKVVVRHQIFKRKVTLMTRLTGKFCTVIIYLEYENCLRYCQCYMHCLLGTGDR